MMIEENTLIYRFKDNLYNINNNNTNNNTNSNTNSNTTGKSSSNSINNNHKDGILDVLDYRG